MTDKVPTLSLQQIKDFDPCTGSFNRAASRLRKLKKGRDAQLSVADAIAAGIDYDDILWVLENSDDQIIRRKCGLWLADCLAHVLHLYEKPFRSKTPRKVIEHLRSDPALTDWSATEKLRKEISYASVRADNCVNITSYDDAKYAKLVAGTNVTSACLEAISGYTYEYTASRCSYAAAYGALELHKSEDSPYKSHWNARCEGENEETKWQLERLGMWFSETEPEPIPLP